MGKCVSGLAVALLVLGCSGASDQHADSSVGVESNSAERLARLYETKQASSPRDAKADSLHLVGRWKGELILPKRKGKPKPEEEFVEAMAKAFLSDLWVEFKEDGTFKMNMMVPIEGKYKLKGASVHLTAETMMGMTMDDLEKMGGAASAAMSKEPLILEISSDGKTLRAKGKNGDEGELVFTRA